MADPELQHQIDQLQLKLNAMKALAANGENSVVNSGDLEKPPALAAGSQQAHAPNSDIDAQKELAAIAMIADASERTAAITHKAGIISAQTGISTEQIASGLSAKVESIIAAQAHDPSLYVTNFMPKGGQVNAGVDVGKAGLSGGSFGAQTPAYETNMGNFAAFAGAAINPEGDVDNATIGAKYVSPAFKSNGFTGVGIAIAALTHPLNDKALDAGDISLTGGTAIWHDKTGLSSITTISTNGNADDLIVGQDFSKNFLKTDDGTDLAVHIGGSYAAADNNAGAVAGVLAKTSLGGGVTGWVGADMTAQKLGEINDLGGQLKVGLNFGEASSSEPATLDVSQRTAPSNIASASYTSVQGSDAKHHGVSVIADTEKTKASPAPISSPNNEEGNTIAEMSKTYYALEHHPKQQKAYLNDTAATFAKNTGLDLPVAKQIVLNLFDFEHSKLASTAPNIGTELL